MITFDFFEPPGGINFVLVSSKIVTLSKIERVIENAIYRGIPSLAVNFLLNIAYNQNINFIR